MKIIISVKLNILMIGILIFNFSNVFHKINYYQISFFSSNIENIKSNTSSISFAGSIYRFLGFVRNQFKVFPNNRFGKTTAILSGDNFREPMLLLKLKGLTKDNISFGADFMLNSP